ncbi:uncharacterized protein L201_005909 [Kwoniella dendrophila CBS 6074]|uniref:Cyclin N-terminal domain-containing protein n=1 Tax=Kwoniella dendrophila CBS 6074 TaxID=1295534 RepID=A0AAX4JZR0_9TREE
MRQLKPTEQQWIFDYSALDNTPSLDDGVTLEEELKKRKVTIEYMRSLALRANKLVHPSSPMDAQAIHLRGSLIVGSTLLHRFYMRKSFKDFSEELIASTILFLATKIEEEPLKLRHIVNSTIDKFEKSESARGWYPDHNPNEQPSREYRTWEKNILACEEVVLETLCFDMGVEQPFTFLLKAVKGLDNDLLGKSNIPVINGNRNSNGYSVNGVNGKGKEKENEKLSESIITELGWTLLFESTLSPLSVLYAARIIAFVSLVLIISIIDQKPLSESLVNASELSEKFDIGLIYNENGDLQGEDIDCIKACLKDFIRYINEGLIDNNLLRYIVAEAEEARHEPYSRRFVSNRQQDSAPRQDDEGKQRPVNREEKTESDVQSNGINQIAVRSGTSNGNDNSDVEMSAV